jgi:hypothetical protein
VALDLEPIYDALRKANAAGDTESVAKLSAYLMSIDQQQQAPAPAPVAAPPAPADTQRLRSMGQGMLLGGYDEAEAYLRSLIGENQGTALQDVRSKMQAYQQQSPIESLGYEALGGMAIPAAVTLATGGEAAPVTGPVIAGAMPAVKRLIGSSAIGGAMGGTAGFLGGEGDFIDRASKVPTGVATGALVAPVLTAAVGATGMLGNQLLDAARRISGGRGAKIVETEIQRLMDITGKTVDEIVSDISSGRIMAENSTLLSAVRAMYAQGGKAATTIAESLGKRPEQLRQTALTEMQSRLAKTPDNVLKQFKLSDDALKALEKQSYQDAYKQGGVIDSELLSSVTDALKRSPQSIKNINEVYRAETGKKPFFSFDKSGNIVFERAPTLEDAEVIRRGIQTSVNEAYTSGRGAVGEALKNVEGSLRQAIDTSSPAVAQARAQAAERRSAKDAFDEGRKVFTKSADEVAVLFEQLSRDPGKLSAFRAGTMDAIRNRMSTGQRKTMMSTFSDPNRKEGDILRTVYPQDDLASLMARVENAAASQAAKTKVMGGSDTASSLLQEAKQGSNISAEEVANVISGNPLTMASSAYKVARKLISNQNQNLSDFERDQVARVLVSQDPAIVRKALMDESGMAMFQQQVANLSRFVGRTVPFGASSTAARRMANPQPSQ